MNHETNAELRRVKSLHRLSTTDIVDLLTSVKWGGPSHSTVSSWLAVSKGNKMPANSLDLLKIRLDEADYYEA